MGWQNVFFDIDSKRGIVGGTSWQDELTKAAQRCELVICLISKNWLASNHCSSEYVYAKYLGKKILFIVVDETPLEDLPSDYVAVRQTEYLRHILDDENQIEFDKDNLDRIGRALRQAGLDATFFSWPPEHDPERSPYPGLRALTEDDAGIFFGREARIISAIDQLRSLQSTGKSQLLCILGASGAGKSSFMRAGLLPRLMREPDRFLVLPTLRAAGFAMTGPDGLWAVLQKAYRTSQHKKALSEIKALVGQGKTGWGDLFRELSRYKDGLQTETGKAIILPVDQAEELFQADFTGEGEELLSAFSAMSQLADQPVILVFTIRTDSFDHVLNSKTLNAIKKPDPFVLAPMPSGSFVDIIRKPIARAHQAGIKVHIQEGLIERLLTDIAKDGVKDALPILAFTLERIMSDFRDTGTLSVDNYEQIGGIAGSINEGVETALRKAQIDPALPNDRQALLLLLRRGLIPWLAGIDPETSSPRRRVARIDEIPEEALGLMNLLVEQRILAKDLNVLTGEITLEPAHESLFKQWGVLGEWLAEDLEQLSALDGVRRATRDWLANGSRNEWVVHRQSRLVDAENALKRDDLASILTETDLTYLKQARRVEDQATKTATRRRNHIKLAITGALFSMAIVAFVLFLAWQQTSDALIQEAEARAIAEANFHVTQAQNALSEGHPVTALGEARKGYDLRQNLQTRSVLFRSFMETSPQLLRKTSVAQLLPTAIGYGPSGLLIIGSQDGQIHRSAATSGNKQKFSTFAPPEKALTSQQSRIVGIYPIDDMRSLAMTSSASIIEISLADEKSTIISRQDLFSLFARASVSLTRHLAAIASNDGVVIRHCEDHVLQGDNHCRILKVAFRFPEIIAAHREEELIAVANDRALHLINIKTGKTEKAFELSGSKTGIVWIEADTIGNQNPVLVSSDNNGMLSFYYKDKKQKWTSKVIQTKTGALSRPQWSKKQQALVFICGFKDICLLPVNHLEDNPTITRFQGGTDNIADFAISDNHEKLAALSVNGTVFEWSLNVPNQGYRRIAIPVHSKNRSFALDNQKQYLVLKSRKQELFIAQVNHTLETHIIPPRKHLSANAAYFAIMSDRHIATISSNRSTFINIINWQTGKRVREINTRLSLGPHLLSLTKNGPLVASTNDKRLAVVALDGGVEFFQNPYPKSDIWSLARHPEKPIVYASFTNGAIHAWNVSSLKDLGAIVSEKQAGARADGSSKLSLSPRFEEIVAARVDNQILIHSLKGTDEPEILKLDHRNSLAPTFSPDGLKLAIIGSRGALYIFKRHENGFKRAFHGPALPAYDRLRPTGGAFIPRHLEWLDNTHIAIPGQTAIHIYSINPKDWIARADRLDGMKP